MSFANSPKANANDASEDDEEDYMNMIIPEPAKSVQKETSAQRRVRKQRESEVRGRAKSKAEQLEDERATRETALSKSMLLDPAAASNKGLAMMAKMGFKPGVALGSKQNIGARMEPVGISMKEDRGGIGLDTEKKRKFREEVEKDAKRVKAEEGDYRERVRREREEVRREGQFQAAMRVAERLTDEKEEEEEVTLQSGQGQEGAQQAEGVKQRKISTKPLKQINVLWRALVRKREEKERDRRMRYDLHQSLSRLPTYEDPNEDQDYKLALGKEAIQHTFVEDLEEEDPELDTFTSLEVVERLQQIVDYLRETHCYCFWCKHTYPDKDFEGCPGLTEEEHD